MMKPKIDTTGFGFIVIESQRFEKDVVIEPSRNIRKRRKKLSKRRYGTSHIISLDEAQNIYQDGIEWLIIGTGQNDLVRLSPEAEAFFAERGCQVQLLATPEAIRAWNRAAGRGIGLFHITC
jgi:hypothetical protein